MPPHLSCPRALGTLLCLGLGCAPDRWDDSAFEVESWGNTPAGTLAGTVSDSAGLPVVGALVTLVPSGRGAVSSAGGTWQVSRLLPGSYELVVAAEGYQTSRASTPLVEPNATLAVDTVLAAAVPTVGVLRVTVLDPAGLPAVGMLVTATWDSGTTSALTATDGLATLAGVGGEVVTTTVEDPSGRLASARVGAITVPAAGAAHAALELSGLPAASATPVGSAACAACHPGEAERHAADPHARAMGPVSGVVARDFAAARSVPLGNGATASLGYDGADPGVLLTDSTGEVRAYPVLGLLGGEARGAVPWTEVGSTAWPLPLAYAPASELWPDWPATDSAWVANELSTWFDAEGRFLVPTGQGPAPERSAETQCFGCHASGYSLAERGDGGLSMTASSGEGRWLEAGVGCESCHGPGSEHAAASDEELPYTIVNPARLDAQAANDVCAQCHAGLDGVGEAPYPWRADTGRFRPGLRLADFALPLASTWPVGAADRPSQQANELAASAHATGDWTARCTDCHRGHEATGDHAAGLPLDARDNTLCTSCHLALSFGGQDSQAAAHAGHPAYVPGSDTAAGRCTGCHMPATSTRLGFVDATGAGDLQSHAFVAVAPSWSLADFDAQGASTLPAGHFTPNACNECHAYNLWLFDGTFPGPSGDPLSRDTQALLDAAYVEMFP